VIHIGALRDERRLANGGLCWSFPNRSISIAVRDGSTTLLSDPAGRRHHYRWACSVPPGRNWHRCAADTLRRLEQVERRRTGAGPSSYKTGVLRSAPVRRRRLRECPTVSDSSSCRRVNGTLPGVGCVHSRARSAEGCVPSRVTSSTSPACRRRSPREDGAVPDTRRCPSTPVPCCINRAIRSATCAALLNSGGDAGLVEIDHSRAVAGSAMLTGKRVAAAVEFFVPSSSPPRRRSKPLMILACVTQSSPCSPESRPPGGEPHLLHWEAARSSVCQSCRRRTPLPVGRSPGSR